MCGTPRPKGGAGWLELAEIFRAHGAAYRQTHPLCTQQHRVMRAIETCRTAELGGHLAQCDSCGAQVLRFHSCRNRHCPKPVLSLSKGAKLWPKSAG
ncbi:MAG: transposase zinc-binding domain-containing protein [Gammaproteobacteria bacterium]